MDSTNETATGVHLRPPLAAAAPVDRAMFWGDTCREITQMHAGSHGAIELYRKFGCRFWAPSHVQVEQVLNALDSAIPQWEKAHPELFFQTLELNFPELLKRPNIGTSAAT